MGKRVHVSQVNYLSYLSGPLHVELQAELYTPILCTHPCFSQIHLCSKPTMRDICATALNGHENYAKNDLIFKQGTEAKRMLFLRLGSLAYRFVPAGRLRPKTLRLGAGSWC